jgi:hypothetical protein
MAGLYIDMQSDVSHRIFCPFGKDYCDVDVVYLLIYLWFGGTR